MASTKEDELNVCEASRGLTKYQTAIRVEKPPMPSGITSLGENAPAHTVISLTIPRTIIREYESTPETERTHIKTPDGMMTIAKYMRFTGLSVRSVYYQIQVGIISGARKFGKCWYIPDPRSEQ